MTTFQSASSYSRTFARWLSVHQQTKISTSTVAKKYNQGLEKVITRQSAAPAFQRSDGLSTRSRVQWMEQGRQKGRAEGSHAASQQSVTRRPQRPYTQPCTHTHREGGEGHAHATKAVESQGDEDKDGEFCKTTQMLSVEVPND